MRDIVEVNGSGITVVKHHNYSSFGAITSDTNASYEFGYAYTSRVWDADIELQFNRARWYDAAVGKWLSEDPLAVR